MANSCCTNYVIEGSEKTLRKFLRTLKRLQRESLKKNLYGVKASDFIVAIGVNTGGLDLRENYCQFKIDKDIIGGNYAVNEVLRVQAESSWNPKPDIWRAIKKKYPDIYVFYQSEEFGNEIFCTNDSEGQYFPDVYALDWSAVIEGEDDFGTSYFSNEDDLRTFLKSLGCKYEGAVADAVQRLNSALKCEGNDYYAYLYECSVIDDDYDLTCPADD